MNLSIPLKAFSAQVIHLFLRWWASNKTGKISESFLSSTYLYGNYLQFFNLIKIISIYVVFPFIVAVKILKA